MFLTFFRSRIHDQALTSLVRDPRADVLLLYGDRDKFTGRESYRTWAKRLQSEGHERVQVSCIEGATHFWREKSSVEMLQIIENWLDWKNSRLSKDVSE